MRESKSGYSPAIRLRLRSILVTAVKHDENKKKFLEKAWKTLTYYPENEYDTLIRVAGPFTAYTACFKLLGMNQNIDWMSKITSLEPSNSFHEKLCKSNCVCIVIPEKFIPLMENIMR